MAVTIYDTNVLVQTVPSLKRPGRFLLDRFFPNEVRSDSEFISIDVEVRKRRMAPFVSPLVEGKPVEANAFQTNTFKPPYIKDIRAPDLRRPVKRQIGERIGGEMTGAEREQANLEYELAEMVDSIDYRLEWMAASALASGSITVVGEGVPSTTINYGRDSSLSITLAGAARWGQAGVYPTESLEDWAALVLKASGAVVTDIVFTPGAWKQFRKDQNIRDNILSPNLQQNNAVQGGGIQRGGLNKGTWGTYNLWLYNDWYVDPISGTESPMLTDGTVLMVGADLMGTRAFAPILDPEFAYGALPYAPKSWVTQNPAQRWLMMQSAPLIIPSRVNACLAASVL